MTSSDQRHKDDDAVELFLSTEQYKLSYKGSCKVDIKVLSKMFVVEPYDNETSAIEISIYSTFLQHKNILCNFSSDSVNCVSLVFPTVDACKTVYDVILAYQVGVKQETETESSVQRIKDAFFIPLLKEAKNNPNFNERAKHCVLNMLEDIAALAVDGHDLDCVKSELGGVRHSELLTSNKESSSGPILIDAIDVTQPLDEHNITVKEEPPVSFITETVVDVGSNDRLHTMEVVQHNSRKRQISPTSCPTATGNKYSKTEMLNEQRPVPPPESNQGTVILQPKKIVKSTDFLIHKVVNGNASTRYELIVFTNDEKTLCFPYIFEKKSTGNRFSCINCMKMKHSAIANLRCNEQSGEYFIQFGLIKHACTPAYYVQRHNEVIEPCTSYASLFFNIPIGRHKRVIAVQDKAGTSSPSSFKTSQTLNTDNFVKRVSSPQDSTNENVMVEPLLKSTDFELRTITSDGIQENELITFASSDHKLCYVFFQDDQNANLFFCKKCKVRGHNYAVILRGGDDTEEKYLEFNKKFGHYCMPESYPPAIQDENLLEKDEYELIFTREGNLYPIVYASKEKNLIYSFSRKFKNAYFCDGCEGNSICAALNIKQKFNGQYTVSWLNQKSLHSCEPKPFFNDMQEKALMPGRFKFFYENGKPNDLKLITFPFDDENVKCFIYKYSHVMELFCCIKCLESDHLVGAQIFLKTCSEEYILENNPSKHICEPVDYSSLDLNNVTFELISGLIVRKFTATIWDQKNAIQASNFEFQRNRLGVLNGSLFIFTTKEKDFCYKYQWNIKRSSQYVCFDCKLSAKVFIDENGKYFVRPSTTKHRCDGPIPYQPERKVIRKPDFILLTDRRLIVFTSASHLNCYVYSTKDLQCYKCYSLSRKKNVAATVFTDENGEECVLLNRMPHQCKPQKFSNVVKKYDIQL